MIVNAGVRLDGFHNGEKGSAVPSFETSPMYNNSDIFGTHHGQTPMPKSRSALDWVFHIPSPLQAPSGFSMGDLQISESLTMNRQVWVGSFPDIDINGNGQIDPEERYNDLGKENQIGVGNIATPPEKTTSFEVGTDWNVVSDYTLSLTAYYKTVDNQLSTGTTGARRRSGRIPARGEPSKSVST